MFKKITSVSYLSAGLLIGACVSTAQAAAERYTLDPAHTTVAFLVERIGFAKTLGQFTKISGALSFDQETNAISDLSITVVTSSVGTTNKARDKHVRNKDFLNVKKFPEMTFIAQSATIDTNGTG